MKQRKVGVRPSNAKQCRGLRKDGQRCTAPALTSSPYCFSHDPELAEKRAQARRKGGQHRSNVARLRGLVPPRLVEVYDVLERALREVHDGELEPKAASAMASIARAMVAVVTAGELEERVRSLEAAVER